jgi:hypothetical protein
MVEGSQLWIDVREIDRLVAAGHPAEALALCGDKLLVDLDDDWVLEARGLIAGTWRSCWRRWARRPRWRSWRRP